MSLNIAIDGPSGAGKSTVAKRIAKDKGIVYLDTGAMYRGIGFYLTRQGIDVSDEAAVLKVLDEIKMEIVYANGEQRVLVCGEDVTPLLREHSVSMAASTVSKIPEVRLKLVELQRQIAQKTDCVLDGRDIGTFVLPNAKYKFFITATPKERAERRFLELKERGQDVSYDTVLNDILLRDKQDTEREFAPLSVADDAIVIDTTGLSADESALKVESYLWK